MITKTRAISLLTGVFAIAVGATYYQNPQLFDGMVPQLTTASAPEAAPEKQPEALAAAAPAPVQPAEAVAAAPVPAQEAADAQSVTASFDAVRVESNGDAVIAGHAAPGSDVAVKWNGAIVGEATANAEGSFAIVPEKPLAAGSGALTLESTKDGKTTTSESSVVVAVQAQAPVVVAQIDPVAPTKVEQAGEAMPAGNVVLGAIDYDEQGNIVFSGKAPAGAPVRFYVDNAVVGETNADASGQWVYKGTSAVAVGTHTLRADALNAKGEVISRAETPFMREEPEKVVATAEPAAPAPAPIVVAEAQPAADQPVPPVIQIRRVVIQPGSNLWRVSRKVYGKGRMYTLIFEANRDQIKNPNRVYPGQILAAPEQKG
jgi:nucleoid-associated protein YgaU